MPSRRATPARTSLRELRRSQIVGAARAIVARDGLHALTFGALEEALGFSRGVLTYHFRDKDEIVLAVLESAVDEIDAGTLAQVEASATPAEKVRAVLRANLRGFVEKRDAGLILLSFWGRLSSDAKARRANAALFTRYRDRTASLLSAGMGAGAFAEADARALAAVIVGIVIGLASQAYFDAGAVDLDLALEEATLAILARLRPTPALRASGPRPRRSR